MRIVVFTSRPDLEDSRWWLLLLGMPETDAVLLCRVTGPNHPGGSVHTGLRRRELGRGPGEPAGKPDVPVRVIQCRDRNLSETLTEVAAWRPDLGVSIDAPHLDPELSWLPVRGTLGLHLGTLPEFGEGPPGFWELLAGATEIGASVLHVESNAKTAALVAALRAAVYPRDTLATLRRRAEELGELALIQAVRRVARGSVGGIPQPMGGSVRRSPTVGDRLRLRAQLAVRRWRERSRLRTLVKTGVSLMFLWLVRPVRDLWRRARKAHPVRIFTFHRVSDLCRDGMTVSPALFDQQLAYIARHHEIVDLDRALELLRSGAPRSRPVAAITFDDAYRSVFRCAFPLLKARGMPAAIFTCTDLVGTTGRYQHDAKCPVRELLDVMDWDEHRRVLEAGWLIGGHTATHARLSECDTERLHYELEAPLEALSQHLGLRAPTMSWPFGSRKDITPEALRMIADCGYSACFSSYFGENFEGGELFEIRRIDLGGDHPSIAWKSWMHGFELRSGRRWLAMLGLAAPASGS